MPIIRGDWAEALAPALVPITFREYREKPEQFSRFMKVLPSTSAYEDMLDIHAEFGPLVPKGELETIILDKPIKLGGVRIVHKTFALGFLVSKEFRDDIKLDLVARLARALGKSGRVTKELYGHDVINNGFSTARYIGRDGKALFATDHPLAGTGGTASNLVSPAADLTDVSLEAAILQFRSQKTERGLPIENNPRILLIPPGLEFEARRLLESAGMPGSANADRNDINVLRDQGLTIMVDDWLTDADAWFLLGEDHDLRFYNRQPLETYTWDDLNAGGTFHKVDQRHSQGFSDWRSTLGSAGA